MSDPIDELSLMNAEQQVSDALDALGLDSDQVAASLTVHQAVAGSPSDEDPVCLYLQWCLDPAGRWVQILECDLQAVLFAVLNPDRITWTQVSTVLPAPVRMFCCRLDAGDFPALGGPR